MTANSVLDDSRLFWLYRHTPFNGSGVVVRSIDQLTNDLYPKLFSRQQKQRKAHLWHFLRDLAINWIQSESQFIGVKLNRNEFGRSTIYHRLGIKYDATRRVVHILAENDLISYHRGFFNRTTGEGRITRIRATNTLIEEFKRVGVLEDIKALYPVENSLKPIELRNRHGQSIRLPRIPEVDEMIADVNRYNEALEKADIDIALAGYDSPVKVDLTRKFVQRIFNNSSLNQGGRLSGAWWLNCPSELRSRIVLDKLETVEIDLKALHPVLLYAQSGIDYFQEVGEDPYVVCNVEAALNRRLIDGESTQFRNFFKQMFLVLINNINENKAKAALQGECNERNGIDRRRGRPLTYPTDLGGGKFTRLWDEFKAFHHRIGSNFAGNTNQTEPASMRLMKVDSDFIMKVLIKLLNVGITALSVHDSLVVRHADKDKAYEILVETFEETLRAIGARSLQPRLKVTQFFKEFVPFAKQSHIEDKQLQQRAMDFAKTRRPSYINYKP